MEAESCFNWESAKNQLPENARTSGPSTGKVFLKTHWNNEIRRVQGPIIRQSPIPSDSWAEVDIVVSCFVQDVFVKRQEVWQA